MLGYVVEGKVFPHSKLCLTNQSGIEAYFSDGTEKSKAVLNKIALRKKKANNTKGIVIPPPRYRLTFKTGRGYQQYKDRPLYMWDIISVFDVMERLVYSKLDFMIQMTKADNIPPVKLTGKSFSTYLLLVEMLIGHMEQLEERTNVPTAVLEKFLRYTYYLVPEHEDWNTLSDLAGFDSLTYEPEYDAIKIVCAGSQYNIKRGLLVMFGNIVAPIITKILYRSSRVLVGNKEVSLVTLYHIKKQLDEEASLEYQGKDFACTEEMLRALHTDMGLTALSSHGEPILQK